MLSSKSNSICCALKQVSGFMKWHFLFDSIWFKKKISTYQNFVLWWISLWLTVKHWRRRSLFICGLLWFEKILWLSISQWPGWGSSRCRSMSISNSAPKNCFVVTLGWHFHIMLVEPFNLFSLVPPICCRISFSPCVQFINVICRKRTNYNIFLLQKKTLSVVTRWLPLILLLPSFRHFCVFSIF